MLKLMLDLIPHLAVACGIGIVLWFLYTGLQFLLSSRLPGDYTEWHRRFSLAVCVVLGLIVPWGADKIEKAWTRMAQRPVAAETAKAVPVHEVTLGTIGIGVVCGLIFLASVAWQVSIWVKCSRDNDTAAYTFGAPLAIGGGIFLLTLIGTIALGILSKLDTRIYMDTGKLLPVTGCVLIMCVCFYLKSCVSAILIGATVSWSAWSLLMHGEWSFIPIFATVFDVVSESLPRWVGSLYTTVSLGFSATSVVRASLAD